ncbi:MAG: response regulator [Candidatus Omnitrophica bacterium]|nr:response regulator [Candidatus Omnitrophota bacterium]
MAKRILVVDDEPDIIDVATTRLKYSGYEIVTAFNAEEAIVYLENGVCDLILLDLLLPGMQGDELCKKLKLDEKYKNIPVILFTASAMDIAKVANDARADDYVTKPFEPNELLSKINKFIG